ncbi:MAG TPA: thioredoxin-dependent thiol peroxidase [Saprospiraceae bacterium]|nr:thioredoxin-dependent thiol peroxidase [Saprospiraceae bacterium]
MTHLKSGDPAPFFSGVNENNTPISLADYKGKKLVLYFYPKDDTPGCTAEACSLRDNYHRLQAEGYEILGVSPDTPKKHQAFIKKYNLPFSLISDESKEILNAYSVWGPKSFMGRNYDGVIRTTFIINKDGIIEEVISDVKTKDHANQILT